ncbi:D(2) dopamine receptor A-like [Patella vulgata]|uniref:D(2) dopamine receptor A-like n=1 Tax=Patella vulgata TaxID=6465 RepID=UPI0021804EFC|nr:D(2) dopamine receptor A-like [Patella vulgata]
MNLSNEERLRKLSDENAMTLLPAILYVGILMVVGFLGNGLKLGAERRTTIIAFLVTTVFVLSYLPYLGITFFNEGYNYDLHGSSLVAYNLFLRSYFVNSAVNPIIYGLLNLQFSRAVKAMFKRPTFDRRIYDVGEDI